MDEMAVCCFCGNSLREQEAVLLVLHPPGVREESQSLYAHRRCLLEKLDPSVPLHPDLMEDEEAS